MAKNFGQELKMTQTGFLTSKSGKTFIRIYFSRPRSLRENDTAEGIIPGYKILKSDGFEEEEIAALEFYIKHNREEIVKRAKVLSNPLRWL
ncbi:MULTISPECIES: hypothetical protein [unclassified Butyrivibrio]|uniref:hypothetical protein n=1 Tax=unclassified Butyrivibrio TaxID=2639466 RepID=UPI0003B48712|nr:MULTISPECIES: hypothetical protein [unclassified Butyrivibrio]SDB24765.1 hypothetical protein SAMN02910263_01198 [Butyrivibrio sp. INlla16]SEL19540.1 hypothetical protein SAMN04487770_10730 [Butyrivibrio sp. ob235]